MVTQPEVIWVPAAVKCNSRKGSQLVFDYFNESHPCYSEAKASKNKRMDRSTFCIVDFNTDNNEI